jgi:hypothetical protein
MAAQAIRLNVAWLPGLLPTPDPRQSAFIQVQGHIPQISVFTQYPRLPVPIFPTRSAYPSHSALLRVTERCVGVRPTAYAVRAAEPCVRKLIDWESSDASRDRRETESDSSSGALVRGLRARAIDRHLTKCLP